MAGSARRTREPDLRALLAEALPTGKATHALLDALCRVPDERASLEDREKRTLIGADWVRTTRRVGLQLPRVLDRLLKVFLSIDPYTKREFDKVVPGWEEHLLQLLRLRAVAQECAAIAVPLPGKGVRARVPHLIARRVADILFANGVRPTRGDAGPFGRTLAVLLADVGFADVDVEGLTRAVVAERRASEGTK